MSDCIFCKIANGEVPVTFVYEDDVVVAFDDIAPQAPIHTLVVPREHHANLSDDLPPDVAAGIMAALPQVAAVKGVAESGYRVIINTGPDAQQTVQHLHVHLMGGREMAHGMVFFAE